MNGKLKKYVQQKMEKEFQCHVQFVVKICKELAEKYKPENKTELEIATILHDIGRINKSDSRDHSVVGSEMLQRVLIELQIYDKLNKNQIQMISSLIANHNANKGNTLEEKILITADNLSKIQYHEAFMLLCKKQTYDERAKWGLKYLEKGFKKIQFPEIKSKAEKKYREIKDIYQEVLDD